MAPFFLRCGEERRGYAIKLSIINFSFILLEARVNWWKLNNIEELWIAQKMS